MKTITFVIRSLLTFQLDLVDYPELSSPTRWIQKGINALKTRLPDVIRYLSRQKILAELDQYNIILEAPGSLDDHHAGKMFRIWIQKEKMKRLALVIIEGIILPFTPFLAILPGPNIFFYVPALLFYYHFTSYRGLRRVHVNDLNIRVVHVNTLKP